VPQDLIVAAADVKGLALFVRITASELKRNNRSATIARHR
jgi:hypothetical protein